MKQPECSKAYKCRVRAPWWKVPRVAVPDAFLTYMNHDTPRIVTNRAGVACLNSIHGVTFADAHRQLAMDLLPMAALNTVTLLGSELVGRSYGGGVLKIEPKGSGSVAGAVAVNDRSRRKQASCVAPAVSERAYDKASCWMLLQKSIVCSEFP